MLRRLVGVFILLFQSKRKEPILVDITWFEKRLHWPFTVVFLAVRVVLIMKRGNSLIEYEKLKHLLVRLLVSECGGNLFALLLEQILSKAVAKHNFEEGCVVIDVTVYKGECQLLLYWGFVAVLLQPYLDLLVCHFGSLACLLPLDDVPILSFQLLFDSPFLQLMEILCTRTDLYVLILLQILEPGLLFLSLWFNGRLRGKVWLVLLGRRRHGHLDTSTAFPLTRNWPRCWLRL